MGMSSYVMGIVETDAEWDKMKKVYMTCKEAGVDIPVKVDDYFEGNDPTDMDGMEVEIDDAVEESQDDCREHFTVDLTKLPKNVKKIRFTNSY
jgi:hypothetical protein